MANNYSGAGLDLPFTASGDLNAVQYKFVQPAQTARMVEQGTGGSAPAAFGVLQNDPRSGEGATVRYLGTTNLFCSAACGAIGYRDWLTCGSTGEGVLATAVGASSVLAMSLGTVAAGASGILIEALLVGGYPTFGGSSVVDNTP